MTFQRRDSRRGGLAARAGFTLVEVLAALTMVLIALPVAMEAISLTNAASTRARRQLEAANLAASKLAELVATNAWQNGNNSGDFSNYSTNFPDYTWTSTVTQYEDATTGTTAAVANPTGATLGGSGASGSSSGSALGSSSSSAGATLGGTSALSVTLEELDVTVSWTARNQTFSVTVSTLIYPGTGTT